MSTRKEFIKQMLLISGATGIDWTFPKSLQRALEINPEIGSTYLDAEHVVILMQENRSFDHCYGSLQGVRGFNDRHTVTQPNGNCIWAQSDKKGNTYTPFHFDIKDTKITWMGSIPHSRASQIDAWNNNRHDGWIDAKRSSHQQYAAIPITMGHYSRSDLPFHYAMADTFTVCDQNFSSLLGPTRPNRLFLFTGTNREQKSGNVEAILKNSGEYQWKTMPERLQEHDVSWRIYQNDISKGGGLKGEERSWLANLGPSTNTMEVFSQYNVNFYSRFYDSLKQLAEELPTEIDQLKEKLKSIDIDKDNYDKTIKALVKKQEVLEEVKEGLKIWSPEEFEKLPQHLKDLHNHAFVTNKGDANYRSLTDLHFEANQEEQTLSVPKGDMFYQFRKDVNEGQLPTVSWLIPSARFSDHPSSPWYGAWFVSEVLDILTQNPETWKKTIFILTYDENDGYYDHVVPFTAPDPANRQTGKCSIGVNQSGVEYTYKEQRIRYGDSKKAARSGPIGLGFRVPMVIASPWSRGGKVCSQVFDHTSILQFLEHFINKKFNKGLCVDNISNWRRAVCGNLVSAFQKYEGSDINKLDFLDRDTFVKQIYQAQFKEQPKGFRMLTQEEINELNSHPKTSPLMSHQEPGSRSSCLLPYELYADSEYLGNHKMKITLQAGNKVFGKEAAGSPFKIYASQPFLSLESEESKTKKYDPLRAWDYTVNAGDTLQETFSLTDFRDDHYHFEVFGPNGFYRAFQGSVDQPEDVMVSCRYELDNQGKTTGNIALFIHNRSNKRQKIKIIDQAYDHQPISNGFVPDQSRTILLDLKKSHGWYDFEVKNENPHFSATYAGRVESEAYDSITDPAMA